MNRPVVKSVSRVTDADLASARLGSRFNRLDLASQLAVLAVEKLSVNFEILARDRIGICLAARAGSLSTDIEYWKGRALVGGPSPTLFAYTLPSAAIGEIAIRHRITGPNLCFWGDDDTLLFEAGDLILRGDADSCVCVSCNVVSVEAADMLGKLPVASVSAFFLGTGGPGNPESGEIDRDTESLSAKVRAQESVR
jgi:3-oxoacyl-(acyl-carrier-protein) synthase